MPSIQNLRFPGSDEKPVTASTEDCHKDAGDDFQPQVDTSVHKSLLRKLDYRMMPVFFIMYFLNHWDRNGLPQARLNHIEKDLKLKGVQYNVCISILYVGYLIAGVPSNMLITRIRPSIYLGVCMCGWAVVSGCTALADNYTHLLVLRLLLGFMEAPFYPGALYLLSRFYTRTEISTRLAILYCGQLFSSAFSGLLTAAIFATLDGRYGLEGWRWLFIIEGCCTFGVAIIAIFIIPDSPGHTRSMSAAENAYALQRLANDNVTTLKSETPWAGFLSAVKDYKVWILMLMQNMHFSGMSFNQFFPTIVKTLGYNSTVTLALTSPPFVFSALFGLALAKSSSHFNERTWHIVFGNAIALVGFILACATTGLAPRYLACFLFAAGSYSTGSIILGWVSTNISDSNEKKSVSLALVNFSAVGANIYTAYLWPASDGPRYTVGLGTSAGFCFACALVALGNNLILRRENKKRLSATSDGEVKYYVL